MSPIATASARFRKRPIPTVPSHRATNTGANTSGASATVNVTIPATAQVGDYAFFIVSRWGLNKHIVTPPTGFTQMIDHTFQNILLTTIWYRVIQSGDPSTVKSVTLGANGAIQGAIAVYQGVGGVSCWPALGRSIYNQPKRIPAQWMGPYDLTVALSGHRPLSASGGTAALVNTGVAGFTTRCNVQAQVPLGVPTGVYIADGVGTPGANGTITHNIDNYATGGFLALHPPGYPPSEELPASLAGKPVIVYGESYECLVSDGVGESHSSEAINSDRMKWRLSNHTQSNNMADAGTLSINICNFAYSNYTGFTYAGQFDTNYVVSQAGTWTTVPNKNCLIVSDLIGNDALQDHDTTGSRSPAKARAGMQNAVDALIRLWLASSVIQQTDGSVSTTGTWVTLTQGAPPADPTFAAGSALASTTPGSTLKVTTTETNIDLIIHAIDDDNYTSDGASYTVHIDGVLHATGTTSNQTKKSTHTPDQSTVQKAIPCRSMSSGSKEIVITHTGASGTQLIFDCYLVQANATPPWIVTNRVTAQRAATLATLGATQGQVDTHNALFDAVCANADFGGRVIVYDPTKSGRWDSVTMIQDNDGLHLAETGDAMYFHEMMKELKARIL